MLAKGAPCIYQFVRITSGFRSSAISNRYSPKSFLRQSIGVDIGIKRTHMKSSSWFLIGFKGAATASESVKHNTVHEIDSLENKLMRDEKLCRIYLYEFTIICQRQESRNSTYLISFTITEVYAWFSFEKYIFEYIPPGYIEVNNFGTR